MAENIFYLCIKKKCPNRDSCEVEVVFIKHTFMHLIKTDIFIIYIIIM